MKVNLLIVAALALSSAVAVAQQQPRSSEALPFASRDGNCPSGHYERRVLHAAEQGQPAGSAAAAGRELPLWLV